MERYFLTTAIDYVNGEPHMGHAYEKIAADVIARFRRLAGYETFFLTGTDEHSLNVARQAEKEHISPKELCDRMSALFVRLCEKLNISYDRFIRTTDQDHIAVVRDIVRRINARGHIYEGVYSGRYCVSCERFVEEGDLVDGRCPMHPSRELERVEEKNYFFALSRFREPLLRHIESHPEFIMPEARRNEVLNRIREGLQDVSISRSTLAWGVPFPEEIDSNQVVYVWFDALINYVTAAGYVPGTDDFGKWWPADLHLIGKDITWFHCVIWPATLMAADMPLPKTVFGHGFLTSGGRRMSKSEGIVVDPFKLVDALGADPLRYYLMRLAPFGQDGDFTFEGLAETYNADLANDLGNLLNRTVAMLEKYFQGRVPSPETYEAVDAGLRERAERASRRAYELMHALDLTGGLAEIWEVVGAANKYIEDASPWALVREGREGRLATVMFNLVEALAKVAVMSYPFIPDAAGRIWDSLGLEGAPSDVRWDAGGLRVDALVRGARVKRLGPLFPRLDTDASDLAKGEFRLAELAQDKKKSAGGTQKVAETKVTQSEPESKPGLGRPPAQASASAPAPAPADDLVSIEEFARLDLRVARVIAAERIEGTDKLLRIEIDLGSERRQIVAGIARHYAPAELVGKQIVVVANLKPARLRGIVSQGMLLAGSTPDAACLAVVTTDRELPLGCKVR